MGRAGKEMLYSAMQKLNSKKTVKKPVPKFKKPKK